ncbi:MAG: ribosome recycling factor [Clostridia bacterium]|nr:ribosome recycling factor [Clostridia bacterium]MBQ3495340.1 ribosome recycling factor [Clostridia bacterium]MBQ4587578.1 ribosome recycling factor [Clostridia bacterium]MBQ6883281.1 ribosome recycling factor [Clostridia bacterium]MBR2933420.1 ribosome recycling factor [Clostridia bacterium]
MEKVEMILLEGEERTEKTISVLKENYIQIRLGRANPHVLDKVMVDFYGQPTPVNQMSNISVQDGKCLVIAPWDKSLLKNVEKAVLGSNVGITPTNDGNVIRLVFPDLTEERRRDISKQVRKMGEDAKVAIRNIRRDVLDTLKKMKTNKEVSEDEYTLFEKDVNDLTNKAVESIDKLQADKEKDVMTV